MHTHPLSNNRILSFSSLYYYSGPVFTLLFFVLEIGHLLVLKSDFIEVLGLFLPVF